VSSHLKMPQGNRARFSLCYLARSRIDVESISNRYRFNIDLDIDWPLIGQIILELHNNCYVYIILMLYNLIYTQIIHSAFQKFPNSYFILFKIISFWINTAICTIYQCMKRFFDIGFRNSFENRCHGPFYVIYVVVDALSLRFSALGRESSRTERDQVNTGCGWWLGFIEFNTELDIGPLLELHCLTAGINTLLLFSR